MAVANKGFAYVKQGQVLPAAGGASATSGFAYVKQDQPFPVVQAVANIQTSETRVVTQLTPRIRRGRVTAWLGLPGKAAPAAPAARALGPVLVESGSPPRRPNGRVIITRGAAKIGPADVMTRPVVIARGSVPPGKRAIRPSVVVPGAARIGLADPRTRPVVVARGSVPPARRALRPAVLTKGAAKISATDPLTRPTRIVKGQPKHTNGSATFSRGAAKIGAADPVTRPALLVRSRVPWAKRAIRPPLLLSGAARLFSGCAVTDGGATVTDGGVTVTDGCPDMRVTPSTTVRPIAGTRRQAQRVPAWLPTPRRRGDTDARLTRGVIARAPDWVARTRWRPAPWTPANRKEPGLATVRPSRRVIVTTVVPPKRTIRPPWLARSVKDTPVVVIGRTRPATVIASASRRRAVTPAFVGKPARLGATDARLTQARTILPASRPIRARVQPWMPAAARTVARVTRPATIVTAASRRRAVLKTWQPAAIKVVASSVHPIQVAQSPLRPRRVRGTGTISGRSAAEVRVIPPLRVVSAATTRHRTQPRQPRLSVVWSKAAIGLPDLHATFGLQPALSATFAPTAQPTASLGLAHGLCASFVLAPALSAAFDLRRAVRSMLVLEGWHEEP